MIEWVAFSQKDKNKNALWSIDLRKCNHELTFIICKLLLDVQLLLRVL